MTIPKAKSLREQAATSTLKSTVVPDDTIKVYKPGEVIPIKRVVCYNDFVAILQFRVESTLVMAGEAAFKNEGMVVGVGPGLPGPNGGRTPSQLKLGDVVTFYGNPTTAVVPSSGVFEGQKIIIVPERYIICGLNPVPFMEVETPKVTSE